MGASALSGTLSGWGYYMSGISGNSVRGEVSYTADCTLFLPTNGTLIPDRPILSMAPMVPVGTTLTVGVQGESGQFIVLAVDFSHDYAVYPVVGGAFTLTNNHLVVGVVVLDSAGTGAWSAAIPAGPAFQGLDVFAQGVGPVAGAARLTTPAVSRLR